MPGFELIRNIRKIFRKSRKKSESFNEKFSSGEIDRTPIDPQNKFTPYFMPRVSTEKNVCFMDETGRWCIDSQENASPGSHHECSPGEIDPLGQKK